MRNKTLVLKKLEALDNLVISLKALVSSPNTTHQQVDDWHGKVREKLNEIETLINTEQEFF